MSYWTDRVTGARYEIESTTLGHIQAGERLRTERRWSYERLAIEADVGIEAVRRIAHAQSFRPRQVTVARIAHALGVEVPALFERAAAS